MDFLKKYISALRLRTIPLSLSGVLLGCMLAYADFHVRPVVVAFIVLTAVLLQILSNVSNELGDFLRGNLSGHERSAALALKSGELTAGGLKMLVRIMVALSIASGLAMIYFSFGTIFSLDAFVFMIFGYMSIRAAMRYTLGSNPYGYRGLGDVYVFVFFGLVAVMGSYFVCTHTFGTAKLLLPAFSAGALGVAVLNVNNMRDIEPDRAVRVTVAGKLGERGAKIYHTVLIAVAWAAMIAYAMLCFYDPWHYLFVLSLPLFIWHLVGVWKNSSAELDMYLPELVFSALLFCLLAGGGFLIYLI